METVYIIGVIAVFGILFGLLIYLIIGGKKYMLDGIFKIAADKTQAGIHIFGTYTAPISNEFSSNAVEIRHIFIRFSDGKKIKTVLTDRSGEPARKKSGYSLGFSNFETDIWKKYIYKQSCEILGKQLEQELEIDEKSAVQVNLDDDKPVFDFKLNNILLRIVKIRDENCFFVECIGSANRKINI